MKELKDFIQVDDVKITIGDIFCDSWGYEQTNVDFYQVVSLHGKKSVSLRKIAQRVVKPALLNKWILCCGPTKVSVFRNEKSVG